MPAPNPAPAPAPDAAALSEIRARADAATPAPWTLMRLAEDDGTAKSRERMKEYVSECIAVSTETEFFTVGIIDGPDVCHAGNGPTSAWNGDFIAHARADIPALLAEVERLNAEVARLADAEMVSWLMMQQLIYQGRATPRVYRLSGSAAWHLEWYDHSRVTRRDSTAGAFEMPTLENLPPEDRAQIADAFAKWKEARDAR